MGTAYHSRMRMRQRLGSIQPVLYKLLLLRDLGQECIYYGLYYWAMRYACRLRLKGGRRTRLDSGIWTLDSSLLEERIQESQLLLESSSRPGRHFELYICTF